MIASFGGRCTSAISGKTDYLVVGKEPGRSKVGKARERDTCALIGVDDLKALVTGDGKMLGNGEEMVIEDFSSGYYGNALKLGAADEQFVREGGAVRTIAPKPAKKRRMYD